MSTREIWFDRNEQAEGLEYEGRLHEALVLYETNAREGCDVGFTYERMASILRKLERHDEAVIALDRAIEIEARRGPSDKLVRLKERRSITADIAVRPPSRRGEPHTDEGTRAVRPTRIPDEKKGGCATVVLAMIMTAALAGAVLG